MVKTPRRRVHGYAEANASACIVMKSRASHRPYPCRKGTRGLHRPNLRRKQRSCVAVTPRRATKRGPAQIDRMHHGRARGNGIISRLGESPGQLLLALIEFDGEPGDRRRDCALARIAQSPFAANVVATILTPCCRKSILRIKTCWRISEKPAAKRQSERCAILADLNKAQPSLFAKSPDRRERPDCRQGLA